MRAYRTEETKGKIGENALRTWADEVGLVVNESGDDRAGWDYILESAPEAGDEAPANPFGHSDSFPLRTRVQVKATDKTDGFIDIKLSNWLRLVEDPNPSFFFIAELDGGNTPQRVYLVHVDEPHWKEVLHRRRQNEVRDKKPLHKQRLRLSYAEGRLLDQLNGQGLLDALAKAIGPSGSAYSLNKLERVQALGFEDGNASIRVDFPNEEGRHPFIQLADVEIGLKPSIPFIKADVYPARFGIADEEPALTIQGGSLATLPPEPRASVDVRFAVPLLAEEIRFEGELYAPGALAATLHSGGSPDGLAVRVTARCFEAIARWGGSSTIRYFTPEPTKPVPLKDLHTLARLTELYVRAAQEQLEVEVEVTYDGGRVVLLSGPTPPHAVSENELIEQLSFSRLIEVAWSLARKFEVESRTEISMAQLAAGADSIESLTHLVEGRTGGTLTFSWSPGSTGVFDLRDHAQDVVIITEVELGNQRLFVAAHPEGQLVAGEADEKEWVEYRVDYSGTDHHILAAAPAGSAEPDMGALGMRSVRALGRKAIIAATPLKSPTE